MDLRDNTSHVVITPDGLILRYPRLSLAKAMWVDQSVIFTRPEHLVERCTLHAMNFYAKKLTGNDPGWVSKDVASRELWPILLRKASPHNPFTKSKAENSVRAVARGSQGLLFAAPEFWDEASPKLAPQAYVLGRYLAEHEPLDPYTWDQVEQMVRSAHDENVLKTRQDPVRIFNYYVDKMLELGLLTIVDTVSGHMCDRPRNEKKVKIIVKTGIKGTLAKPTVKPPNFQEDVLLPERPIKMARSQKRR